MSVVGKRMRRPARKREEWILLVKEASINGESVQEFCARRGITEHSFYKWRLRLRAEGSALKEALFVPVRVRAEAEMLSPPSQIRSQFFMHGAGGVRIEFPSGCTAEELTLVAGVLSC